MKIPKGWRKVTLGKTRIGDKMWGKTEGRFFTLTDELFMFKDDPVEDYHCVIRKVKQ